MAIRPGRSAKLDAKHSNPKMEALKSEARAALDLHMDNKKSELIHELTTRLEKFEQGNYTDDLRADLDALKTEASNDLAAAQEAQVALKGKLSALNAKIEDLGAQGDSLKLLMAEVETSREALDTKLAAVKNKVTNFTDMAGKALSGTVKRIIGLP